MPKKIVTDKQLREISKWSRKGIPCSGIAKIVNLPVNVTYYHTHVKTGRNKARKDLKNEVSELRDQVATLKRENDSLLSQLST